MNGFGFALPAAWPALLLVPPVALWCAFAAARRRARAEALLPARRVDALLGPRRWVRSRRALGALAAVAATLALLRPVAGELPGEPLGADVVLCADVSRSMRARDVAPDRLGALGATVAAAADAAFGARFGLVAFAGEARLLAPLTADLAAVAMLATNLDPGLVPRAGSDLGAALRLAGQALGRAGRRGGAIVVLTDGEDFGGAGRAAAAELAAVGIEVHCLGFGTVEGSKIVVETETGQRYLQDGNGRDVVTALDPASLTEVAAAGGGTFALAGPDALATLYERHLRPRALAAAHDDALREQAHRFQWPLLVALLAWMLRTLLPERRR